jgi:hypothetical protein
MTIREVELSLQQVLGISNGSMEISTMLEIAADSGGFGWVDGKFRNGIKLLGFRIRA